jgi:Fe-S cluster biogenesis protein NfuA
VGLDRVEARFFEERMMSVDVADKSEMESGVLAAIEAIRPALQSDGGDIVFNQIDADNVVHVTLVGACGTCAVSTMTLKAGVERIIMDRVPGITEVVADNNDEI